MCAIRSDFFPLVLLFCSLSEGMFFAFFRVLASVCSIIVKCPKPVIVPDISAEISVLDTAREMHSALVEIGKLSIEIRNLNLKGEKLLSELEQMRSTYGVCPTCGRLLEEVH